MSVTAHSNTLPTITGQSLLKTDMALVIQDKDTPPPERWQYPDVNGNPLDAGNWTQLIDIVTKHYSSNAAPVPSEQMIVDHVCKTLRVRCFDSHTRVPLINRVGLPYTPTRACCGGKK